MRNRFLSEWMRYNNLTSEELMKLHDFERFDHQDFAEAADAVKFVETLHGLKGTKRIVIDSDYDVDFQTLQLSSQRITVSIVKKLSTICHHSELQY